MRGDVLEEIDGPVREYGLKRLHRASLNVVPHAYNERADPRLLEMQCDTLKAASVDYLRAADFHFPRGL